MGEMGEEIGDAAAAIPKNVLCFPYLKSSGNNFL